MVQKVKDAFLMERELQKTFGIKFRDSIDGFKDFVFLNRFGKVHNNGTLNKALRRIVRDCNLSIMDNNKSKSIEILLVPHLSNHIFRHPFTTRLNEQNINTKAMQSILGHSDFRVVKVKNCEEVPKSKKLLKFTLDDGSEKERVILSGIKEYYSAESLIGKTLLAICNLPPRKMMGIDSEGMIISAICEYDGEEKLNLIMLDDNIPAGSKLY